MAEGEESLGSSLDRQISKLNDVQQTMKNSATELSRLRDSWISLKQGRTKLSSECAQKESDRVSLLAQVTALRKERDGLRQEVAGSTGETSQIAASSSSLSLDPQGKLKRRLWAEEQKNAELCQKMKDMEGEKAAAVEQERNIARGLRRMIGELEEKARNAKSQLETVEKDRVELGKKSKDEEAHLNSLIRQKTAEMDEVRTSLKDANQRINKLVEEKDDLSSRLMDAESKIKAEAGSPRKALQPRPANSVVLTRPQSPATPSKSKQKHTPPTSPVRFSPTTGLAKRYTHLEAQHEALRSEYTKLQERHAADLKHWKEYKALELARREVKVQRKADRKAAGKDKSSSRATPVPHPSVAPPGTSRQIPPVERANIDLRPALDAPPVEDPPKSPLPSQESEKLVSASEDSQVLSQPVKQVPERREPPVGPEETDHDEPLEADYESETENELLAPAQASVTVPSVSSSSVAMLRQDSRTLQVKDDRTIRARPSPTKKRLEELLKEGKWLGGDGERTPTSKPGSFKPKRRTRSTTPDEAMFSKDKASAGYSMDTPTTLRTPLIRDRGAGLSSLRRSAVQESAAKRKRGDLEGLTPSQKTRELKRLSSLTGVEKREYYAEYKGKGRYVPPENLESRVEDEYEIDPKENEGANFQFHDVKRRKADRQKMHGTDCECCREYYEAVGPLPKLNQGPKWRDGPEDDLRPGDDVKEHQNKVSRHRETWQRNPTPPGYWEIGFPNTQKAEEQNAKADEMNKQRARALRQEAEHKDSKWKKRKTAQ